MCLDLPSTKLFVSHLEQILNTEFADAAAKEKGAAEAKANVEPGQLAEAAAAFRARVEAESAGQVPAELLATTKRLCVVLCALFNLETSSLQLEVVRKPAVRARM